MKSIFHHFKVLSIAKNCLRPESAPLKLKIKLFWFFLIDFHGRQNGFESEGAAQQSWLVEKILTHLRSIFLLLIMDLYLYVNQTPNFSINRKLAASGLNNKLADLSQFTLIDFYTLKFPRKDIFEFAITIEALLKKCPDKKKC